MAYAYLWTTKFQSGQVNPKSYLPSLTTKVYGSAILSIRTQQVGHVSKS